jgi:YaiO family outer membrane protein
MSVKLLQCLLTLMALTLTLPAAAQYPTSNPSGLPDSVVPLEADPQRRLPSNLELTAGHHNLSNGYGNWQDVTLRGTHETGPHVLRAELSAKREFGTHGFFWGLADTVTLNRDWLAMVSVGAGDGAFYLPRIRTDAFLYRKWLDQRNLVTSVGIGYYRAPDGHTDQSLSLGGAYYFDSPWIVEGGIRFNHSDPGGISSHQQFVAATYGRVGTNVVTARYGWGNEAYQAIAQGVSLVNFESRQTSVSWRHWLTRQTGLVLSAEHYSNPSYQRQGVNVGLFHQF